MTGKKLFFFIRVEFMFVKRASGIELLPTKPNCKALNIFAAIPRKLT